MNEPNATGQGAPDALRDSPGVIIFPPVLNAVWPLVSLVPMLLVVHWGIIRREERYLELKFGDTYRAYKARVRRWF